jgi:hypothetical protein
MLKMGMLFFFCPEHGVGGVNELMSNALMSNTWACQPGVVPAVLQTRMINSLRTWFERDAGCVAARIPIFFHCAGIWRMTNAHRGRLKLTVFPDHSRTSQ